MGEECKGGVEIQPMSQEGIHCGGQQGRLLSIAHLTAEEFIP